MASFSLLRSTFEGNCVYAVDGLPLGLHTLITMNRTQVVPEPEDLPEVIRTALAGVPLVQFQHCAGYNRENPEELLILPSCFRGYVPANCAVLNMLLILQKNFASCFSCLIFSFYL